MTIAEQSVDYEGFCVETKPDQGPVSTLTLNSPHSNLTYTCRELTPQCIYGVLVFRQHSGESAIRRMST